MPAFSNIRAVTFDVGGTLIDPWPSVGHVYAEVAAENGLPGLVPAALTDRFAAAWRAEPDFDYSRAAWMRLVDETFQGLIAPLPSQTFFEALYQRFEQPTAWRIFEDVRPVLAQLRKRGLRLGIISNWDDRLCRLLTNLDLNQYL